MMLFDKYNPSDWPDFAGHARQVATVRRIIEAPDYDRGAFFIVGPSGVGKSTMARIIAHKLAIESINRRPMNGDRCRVDAVQALQDELIGKRSLFGNIVITVNECHAMSAAAVKAWLNVLEPDQWPKGCTFIFTTTERQAFGPFQKMMQDRMITLDLAPSETLAREFAYYARAIAEVEGLDGADFEDYLNAAVDCECSLRGMLAKVQGGEFFHPSTADLLA